MFTRLILLLLVIVNASTSHAENWPCCSAIDDNVPIKWDGGSNKNVVWKVPIAGKGYSSPIVWENQVFLTTCLVEQQQRVLLCLDATTGQQLWQNVTLNSPLETIHQLNSHASGTPTTDGELIYTAFLKVDGVTLVPAPNVGSERDITPGRVIVTAVDFSGQTRWQVDVGNFVSAHGFCSCPVIYKDLLIINGDHDGDSYIVALDKRSGKEVWRTPREHKTRSYVTPIIRTIDGQDQLVMSGSRHIAGFDPSSGKLVWKVEGPCEQYVASMVFDGQHFLMAAGFPTHHLMAVRPGRGDISQTHVAWHVNKYIRCYVPSPVLVGYELFVADDRGTASCFDSKTGDRIWQERLSGGYSASLVATEKSVYFVSNDGVTKIVRPGRKFELIAENALGENCYASPALSNHRLYLRGQQHLYCIGAAELN